MKKLLLLFALMSSSALADVNIPDFTSSTSGTVPASGGGTTNFLRADGAWASPSGGGSPGGSNGQIQYNNSGAFGGLTDTQLTTHIEDFTSSLSGAVPASGGGTSNFLRADGTWAAPSGGGTQNVEWVNVTQAPYNAACDGSTDDSTAIQDAIDDIESGGSSGVIYIPPGDVCCVNSGVETTKSTRIVGDTIGNSVLGACGGNTAPVVTLNGGKGGMEHLGIYGKGSNNDTGTFGASYPAVKLGSNCVGCTVHDVDVVGGLHSWHIDANDSNVYNITGTESYGSANLYITTGFWLHGHNKFNKSTATGAFPSSPATINAWAASTAYSVGTIVTTGGYYIQCTSAGTSGGSAPTLKNYGVAITDGTATWGLVNKVGAIGVQFDTGAAEVQIDQIDASGFYDSSFAMTNTLSGTPPQQIAMSHAIAGNALYHNFNASSGHSVRLSNIEFGGCLTNNCQSIIVQSSFTEDFNVSHSFIVGAYTGIEFGAGTNWSAIGNQIHGMNNAAINVNSGIGDGLIIGNHLGNSSAYGNNNFPVRLQGTGGDYVIVTGNITHGSSNPITSSRTGGHITITGNQ